MAPNISIVICAYTGERWDDLVASVQSIRSQTFSASETVVVIDYNPSLFERVKTSITGIVAVENRQQRGMSGARNTGIEMATGEVIAFLDDDAVAAPDWLMRLSEGYADPSVLGVGGAIEPVWLDSRPNWFPEEFDWVVGCTYRGMPTTSAAVRNLIGCNMSFRRSVFEVVGGFRHGMTKCDDTDICIRVRQRWPDGNLLYEPRAKVFHSVPVARAQGSYFTWRCYTEGRLKALVSRYFGSQDGLASERMYTLKVLPKGVFRGFADTFRRHDPSGLARSGAIVAGFSLTAVGFLVGQYHTGMASKSK